MVAPEDQNEGDHNHLKMNNNQIILPVSFLQLPENTQVSPD